MKDEVIHIHPRRGDDAEAKCEVHDWPIEGMPKRLIDAMRERHGKGGLNVCTPCLVRARDEAKRLMDR